MFRQGSDRAMTDHGHEGHIVEWSFFPYEDDCSIGSGQTTLPPQSQWYDLLCSAEELWRINNVNAAADFLLKVRADTLLDCSRLTRVYLAKKRNHNGKWSLEKNSRLAIMKMC